MLTAHRQPQLTPWGRGSSGAEGQQGAVAARGGWPVPG